MTEISKAVEAVDELIAEYSLTRDEMVSVLTGPADGGPGSDGRYPVTTAAGNVLLVPGLAALEDSLSVGASIGRPLTSFGAKADARHIKGVSIAPSSNLLNATTAAFSPEDVGKRVAVAGGGGLRDMHFSTVAAYISPSQVQLTTAASAAALVVDHQSVTIGTDCAVALDAALDFTVSSGGTPIYLDGAFALFSPVYCNASAGGPDTGAAITINGLGETSRLHIALPKTQIGLGFANTAVTFRDLSLIGTHGAAQDALWAMYFNTCLVTFDRVGAYGLMAFDAGGVFGFDLCEVFVKNSGFGGCSGHIAAVVSLFDIKRTLGVTVTDCRFIDYGSATGISFSKTGIASAYAWVNVRSMGTNGTDQVTALNQGLIHFRNVRMDEGAFHQIVIGGEEGVIDRVLIEGLEVNAWGGSVGCVKIYNTRDVQIRQSSMGYQNGPLLTAIDVQGCDTVEIDAVQVGRGSTVTKLRAVACGKVIVKDSPGFTDWDVAAVQDFRIIRREFGGGAVPYLREGTITDASFPYPPVVGSLGYEIGGRGLVSRRIDGAWEATGGGRQPWTTIAGIANGWVPVSAEYPAPRFTRDSTGRVTLSGAMKNGGNGIIFTLPVGYRPDGSTVYRTDCENGTARWKISNNGAVNLLESSPEFTILDGIEFYAA